MITPTVGRVLHYYPCATDAVCRNGDQPHTALIASVISDRLVNLSIFDSEGRHYHRKCVTLVQPEDECPEGDGYCEWMSFQQGQSQQVKEALEKGGIQTSTKPTVEELEKILNTKDDREIKINPDGSVTDLNKTTTEDTPKKSTKK